MSTIKNLSMPLKGGELEVRVGSHRGNWCSLMIYKDARVDMSRLDEVVGAENWSRRHYAEKNNLFCSVGIKTEDGDWIFKDDVGEPSNVHSQKGEASDSFKRACTNWGIGRELYDAPYKNLNVKLEQKDMNSQGKPNLFGWYVKNKTVEGKVVAVGIYDKDDILRVKKEITS